MTDNKSSKTKVTRIKAADTSAKAKTKSTAATKKPATKTTKKPAPKPAAINQTPKKANKLATKDESAKSKQVKASAEPAKKGPFKAILGYFAGAWYELKQVRWPNRRATWGLTIAILIFTGFFLGLVMLLDTIFQRLFELLIG